MRGVDEVKPTTDQRYRKALMMCSADLSGADGNDLQASATCFFRMGVVLSRLGEIGGAIRCFNDAFIMRDPITSTQDEHLWRMFHDVQMAIYILGKRNKLISCLAEGDMVHDLIKHRWKQLQSEILGSEIPFAGTDMRAWFETVRIDFPWEMEDFHIPEEDVEDEAYESFLTSVSK
ncbi:MAG: hypothetical protein PHR90_06470 [Sphaerochaetaceae bacterium]|nr:hypothetical protein [Sphaerochaetaceae bacterium]MDX9938565.1 hypothetical protein [Sphaerochaetaceae bacterium]